MSEPSNRPRRTSRNTFTTKSGKTIKVNRSLSDRVRASREAKAQRRAAYLSTLPKERWKRLLYRLEPKRLYRYWFSRDGAIMALKVAGIGFVVVFLFVVGLFAYFRKDLPKIQDINSGNSGGSIAYYDKTGKTLLFQDYDAFKRIPVDGKDISPYMKEATIAIEDKDFYHEGAFNVKGMTRAALNNLKGGSTQGGSTITQQLVKLNEGWTNDHTYSRKVKELILAVELEREYSKNDILAAYLNMAPYSGLDYGVQAAAQDYFHVNASQLTLPQAAMLAAIPKAPGQYSPYQSPNWNASITGENYFDSNGLIARQHYILDQMAEQGYITQDQANAAKKVDILAQVQQMPTSHYAGILAPYFVQAAKSELTKDFPAAVVKTGGWKVITTLDMNLQNLAETTIAKNASNLNRYKTNDAAFVAEDNTTGQVVALVGGRDFSTQQLNFASSARISPGSSIKPYSYTALINNNNNVGASSVLYDTQGALPGYPCTNKATPEHNGNCLFDDTRKYFGPITLRYALGASLNVPAVKAFLSSDPTDKSTTRTQSINKSISTVDALMHDSDGYNCYNVPPADATKANEVQCGAAAGIGNEAYTTLADHVNGIASISRMGQSIPQTYILKVTNASGKVLKQFEQPKGKQVVKQDAAYIVTNMAADPSASYLSGHCSTTTCTGMKFHRYKGWDNAIKTGTNENLDGLMMSWNTKYTAGIWVGNYDRSGWKDGTQPEYMTDPIMKAWMEGAIDNLGNVKPNNWTQPSDIKVAPAYRMTHLVFSSQSLPTSSDDLFPSWYVGNGKSTGTVRTIDRVSGLIATSCTPADARETTGGSVSSFNVDIFKGGTPNIAGSSSSSSSSGAQPTDDVHSCSDSPPVAQITAINGNPIGSANATCPTDGSACDIHVVVQAGTHPFNDPLYPQFPGKLTLTVNGATADSASLVNGQSDYDLVYTPASGASGSIQLTVTATDSVLYQGADTKTITLASASTTTATPSFGQPGINNGSTNGRGH